MDVKHELIKGGAKWEREKGPKQNKNWKRRHCKQYKETKDHANALLWTIIYQQIGSARRNGKIPRNTQSTKRSVDKI